MKQFYLFELFRIRNIAALQILARLVGPLCLSSLSPSKEKKFNIISLPASMASRKNVRKSVVDASNDDDYVGPITRNRSKALDRVQPQPTKESQLHTVISLDSLANGKATTKDSSISKDLEINNESSPTKTFSINSSRMIRNLRNEVPLTHPISSFSPSYIKAMPVMMTNTSTMEEKMVEMEQRVTLLTKALEEKDVKIATLMNKLELQDSSESSLGLEHPLGFALKGENTRVDKGK